MGEEVRPLDDVERLLASIDESLKSVRSDGGAGRGSRYVEPGAQPSLVEHIAKGGSYSVAEGQPTRSGERRSTGLATTMLKALAEGTGSAGGYLVPVETSEEIVK